MPRKEPKSFNSEIYEESRRILFLHRKFFSDDAEAKLAEICGGKALADAINSQAVPPCGEDTDCTKCWLERWCVHMDKSEDERLAMLLGVKAPEKKEEPEEFDPGQGMEDIL